MADNTDKRLITMAKLWTAILLVASVLTGIGVAIITTQAKDALYGIFEGVIIAALGCAFAILVDILLTGYAEIVANTRSMNNAVQDIHKALFTVKTRKMPKSSTTQPVDLNDD